MRNDELYPCESIDAAVFCGDFLENAKNRKEFREYLERWMRALDERDVLAHQENVRRVSFESNWESVHRTPMNSRMHEDGTYGDPDVQSEWEAWQEAASK